MVKRLFCRVLVTVLAASLPALAARAEPVDVVNDFHEALIAAMKSETFDERLLVISPAIDSHFQVGTIARISLGRNWRNLSDQEQADYRGLLQELIVTTYASRFENYDDQVFSISNTEPIGKKRIRVRSILKTRSESVNLDYQLQQQPEGWRIYDVVANGVSDLSLKRSNYASLFSAGSLTAVESDIRDNIARNKAEGMSTELKQDAQSDSTLDSALDRKKTAD